MDFNTFISGCYSSGTTFISHTVGSIYKQWESVAKKIPQLPTFLMSTPPSPVNESLDPSIQLEKFKAVYKKDSQFHDSHLQRMEEYYTKSTSFSFFLLQSYLEKGNYSKILEHVNKIKNRLTPENILALLNLLDKKITEQLNEDQKTLLQAFLPIAVECANKMSASWTIKSWSGDQPQTTDLENKFEIYRLASSLYKKLESKTTTPSLILNKANTLFIQNANVATKEKKDVLVVAFHVRMFYQYALAYKKLSHNNAELFLNYAKEKLATIESIENKLKVLINLSKIDAELLTNWKEGQAFFQVKTDSLEPNELFLAALLYSKIPDLHEEGKGLIQKVSSDFPKPFALAKLYQDYKIEIPAELKEKCEAAKKSIISKQLSADGFQEVEEIILGYNAIGEHDTALQLLQNTMENIATIDLKDHWPLLHKTILVYFAIGEKEKGKEFFDAFTKTNPTFLENLPKNLENAQILVHLQEYDLAKRFLKDCFDKVPSNSSRVNNLLSILQTANQFDPAFTLQLISTMSEERYITTSTSSNKQLPIIKIIFTLEILAVVALLGLASVRHQWHTRAVTWFKAKVKK